MSATRTRVRPNASAGTYIWAPIDWSPLDYPGDIADHAMAAHWLLSFIHYVSRVSWGGTTDFVPLDSQAVGRVMGPKLKVVRAALKAAGLIEVREGYYPGETCKRYRLAGPLVDARWKRRPCEGLVEMKRFERFRTEVGTPEGFKCDAHWHLWSWVQRMEIDVERAERAVARMTGDKAISAGLQLDCITQKLWRSNVDEWGRYHSNVSNLDKQLRACLHVGGAPLVEVDVVNCQPYLFALVILEMALSLEIWDREQGDRERIGNRPGVYTTCIENLSTRVPPDLIYLLQITADGTFYEEFARLSGLTRDDVKTKLFKVIFAEIGCRNTKIKRAFMEMFPTAWGLMCRRKVECGYKIIAADMQRLESDLLIRGVGEVISRHHPEVPVATVHDSWLTTEEHLPLIRRLMADQFRFFPLPPQFREKGVAVGSIG